MWDMIKALLSKRTCPWCHDRPTTWLEKLMGGNKLGGLNWIERFYWNVIVELDYRIGAWKLGQSWHWSRHEKRPDFSSAIDDCPLCQELENG